MPSTAIWAITAIFLVLGLFGTLIPLVPGIGFVFAGILFYALATEFAAISVTTVLIFGCIAALTWAANYLGSLFGAKIGGGGRFSLVGTLIGAFLGLSGGPGGLLLGAFAGGLIGAFLDGHAAHAAMKIAVFSALGTIGAAAFQFIMAFAMIIAFLIAVFL